MKKEELKIIIVFLIFGIMFLSGFYIDLNQEKYPYEYGIKIIKGNTMIEGYKLSNHEVGIIIDAPYVVVADSVITECKKGILLTENANDVIITSTLFDNCDFGIDAGYGNRLRISDNYFRVFNEAIVLGGENCTIVNNILRLVNDTGQF